MQNDRNVLVWVGCNNAETRELITDAIENQLQNYEENMDSLKVVSSPMRSGSLMEVIDDYKPGFFDRFVKQVAEEAVNDHELLTNPQDQLEHVSQGAAHFFATTADLSNRIVLANDLIVSGALTDGPEHKQYYLDQALQMLNGDRYPHVIEKVKREQVADGVIDPEDEADWEWDKGLAP